MARSKRPQGPLSIEKMVTCSDIVASQATPKEIQERLRDGRVSVTLGSDSDELLKPSPRR
jgi:hypothetical protein